MYCVCQHKWPKHKKPKDVVSPGQSFEKDQFSSVTYELMELRLHLFVMFCFWHAEIRCINTRVWVNDSFLTHEQLTAYVSLPSTTITELCTCNNPPGSTPPQLVLAPSGSRTRDSGAGGGRSNKEHQRQSLERLFLRSGEWGLHTALTGIHPLHSPPWTSLSSGSRHQCNNPPGSTPPQLVLAPSGSRTRDSGAGGGRSNKEHQRLQRPLASVARAPLFEVRGVRFTLSPYWHTSVTHALCNLRFKNKTQSFSRRNIALVVTRALCYPARMNLKCFEAPLWEIIALSVQTTSKLN